MKCDEVNWERRRFIISDTVQNISFMSEYVT